MTVFDGEFPGLEIAIKPNCFILRKHGHWFISLTLRVVLIVTVRSAWSKSAALASFTPSSWLGESSTAILVCFSPGEDSFAEELPRGGPSAAIVGGLGEELCGLASRGVFVGKTHVSAEHHLVLRGVQPNINALPLVFA